MRKGGRMKRGRKGGTLIEKKKDRMMEEDEEGDVKESFLGGIEIR